MKEKKLLLFDIDGTILTTFGQAKNAFSIALKEVFGTHGEIDSFSWSGKLDQNIVFELMERAGFSEKFIQKNLSKTLRLYEKILKETIKPEKVFIKEGIVEVLEKASKDEDILMGLCTGNTPEGAKIKLSTVDLYKFFSIGGYGTDAKKREELPPIAKKRAEQFFNVKIESKNVFVIGDSPADIESAKANGYLSVGVFSGFHKKEELEKYKPDLLLKNFKEGEEIFWRFVKNGTL